MLPQFKNLSSNHTIVITKSCYDNKFKLTLGEIRKSIREHYNSSGFNEASTSKNNSDDFIHKVKVKSVSVAFTILQTKVRKMDINKL